MLTFVEIFIKWLRILFTFSSVRGFGLRLTKYTKNPNFKETIKLWEETNFWAKISFMVLMCKRFYKPFKYKC